MSITWLQFNRVSSELKIGIWISLFSLVLTLFLLLFGFFLKNSEIFPGFINFSMFSSFLLRLLFSIWGSSSGLCSDFDGVFWSSIGERVISDWENGRVFNSRHRVLLKAEYIRDSTVTRSRCGKREGLLIIIGFGGIHDFYPQYESEFWIRILT